MKRAQVLQHSSEAQRPLHLVTYGCGMRTPLPLPWVDTWLSGPSPPARFLQAITASSRPAQVWNLEMDQVGIMCFRS